MKQQMGTEREQELLARISSQYAKKGYRIHLRPSDNDLPEFLAGLEPDLLVENDQERVVVEVKSRADLSDSRLVAIARALEKRPGWRFELAVARAEYPSRPESEHSFSQVEINQRAEVAKQALAHGLPEAGLVLLWSAMEGAMRLVAERHSISLDSIDPSYVMKALVAQGLCTNQEYRLLSSAMRVRNGIAHGFKVSEDPSETFRSIESLLNRIMLLLV